MTRTLTIEGTGKAAQYRIAASGPIVASEEGNATINNNDAVNGHAAIGSVKGGIDEIKINGEILLTHFTNFDSLKVTLDGNEVQEDFGLFDNPNNNYEFESEPAEEPEPTPEPEPEPDPDPEPKPEPEPTPDPNGITGPVKPSDTGAGCGMTQPPDDSNVLNSNDYNSIQDAINAASNKEKDGVLIPSGTHTEGNITSKSGVDIFGEDGAKINSTSAECITVEDVSNVHIHNLVVEAKEQNAGRVIGSGEPGDVSNITISDCTLSGNANGVSLRLMEKNTAENVTIRHCDISKIDRHGIFFGTDNVDGHPDATGFIKNPTIINNHVHDMYRWMGITLAGRETGQCSDGYVAGNYCDASMWSYIGRDSGNLKHDNWTNHGITFEEWVVDTVVEHNYVDNFQKTGIGVTGGARRNVFRFNEVIDSRMGIRCAGHLPHPDDPTNNEFHDNVLRNPSDWAVFNKESGGNNLFENNLFIGNDKIYKKSLDNFVGNVFK